MLAVYIDQIRLFSLSILLGLLIFPITANAQSNSQSLPLQKQAEVVQTKQESANQLRSRVAELKQANDTLQKDLLDLKAKQQQLESLINLETQNIAQTQTALQNPDLSADAKRDLENKLQTAKAQLSADNNQLFDIKNKLTEKQSQLDGNNKEIEEATKTLETKTQEVQTEVNSLQREIADYGQGVAVYAGLILLYWLIARLVSLGVNRLKLQPVLGRMVVVSFNTLAAVATFITLLVAFIGNLTLLLASFGVLSAALVVALQDFVSSFFAWLLIQTTRQYRVRDTISITTGKGLVTGSVKQIGVFRTTINEKVGGQVPDRERLTGRLLSFPNNLVLKESLTNHTKEHLLIWHSFEVTVTYESDAHKAKALLQEICEKRFEYMVENRKKYMDGVENLHMIFKPQVNSNIAADGVHFTIWFACRIGTFRQVLEMYNFDVLDTFKAHGIELAYSTQRVILEGQKS